MCIRDRPHTQNPVGGPTPPHRALILIGALHYVEFLFLNHKRLREVIQTANKVFSLDWGFFIILWIATNHLKFCSHFPVFSQMSPSYWLSRFTHSAACTCMYVCVSANHPYLQPGGWITKGAAQRDRPNAYERRLWLPPNSHEWSRSTAAKPDVFDLGKGQTTTPRTPCPTPYTKSVWVL